MSNMTRFVKIVLLTLFFTFLKSQKYSKKWDYINVDEILSSERLLENYKKCLMDQGVCTPEGLELKKNIPTALKNNCLQCSPIQKAKTEKVIDFLIENKQDWWDELQKKYDPTGTYYERRMMRKTSNESTTEKDIKPGKSLGKNEKA